MSEPVRRNRVVEQVLLNGLSLMSNNLNHFFGRAIKGPVFGTCYRVPSNVTSEQSGNATTTPVEKNRPGGPIKATYSDSQRLAIDQENMVWDRLQWKELGKA